MMMFYLACFEDLKVFLRDQDTVVLGDNICFLPFSTLSPRSKLKFWYLVYKLVLSWSLDPHGTKESIHKIIGPLLPLELIFQSLTENLKFLIVVWLLFLSLFTIVLFAVGIRWLCSESSDQRLRLTHNST